MRRAHLRANALIGLAAIIITLLPSLAAAQCVLTCPTNVSANTAQNTCSAAAIFPSPNDNGDNACGLFINCVPASGSSFALGTTTVTCTESGTGMATCQLTVTVNDTQAPNITCPANVTAGNDLNLCSAVRTYPAPVVTDNCSVASTVCSPASGSSFPKGTTTVTCTVTDGSSNTAMCDLTETINDTQPPNITCPANIIQSTDPGLCTAVVPFAAPVVSDNCPGVGAANCAPASGSTLPKGTTTATCTTADTTGNTATCGFTARVNDTEPPTIDAGKDQTRLITDEKFIPVSFPPPVSHDNCPGVTDACVPPSGSEFPTGTTTVTCTATDTSANTALDTLLVFVSHAAPLLGAGMLVVLCAGLAALAVRRLRASR